MYFAMDEIGFENAEKIKLLESESNKWRFIYDIAKEYEFNGIHFTPSLYKEFGLDLHNIPTYYEDFKLTFHLGGLYKMISNEDYERFDTDLCDSFEIAIKHRMHDVSIHPPHIFGLSSNERKICLSLFNKAIEKWTSIANERKITFSLETHVSKEYFLFRGIEEYILFTEKHPDLGILIDISHNYFDDYKEDEIISFLGTRNVRALHISDTRQNVDFRKGTHLAIGEGTVNFKKLLNYFDKIPNIFGVLEIKADNKSIMDSLNKLKNLLKEKI